MDKNLGYLLNDSARLLRRAFDERTRQSGFTSQQARLLRTLERYPGQNQAFYAEQLEIEPITLCRMIDRMEEGGLVERTADPRDRRARLLRLTPRSRGELDRISKALEGLIDTMMDGIDEPDARKFGEILQRISANLSTAQKGLAANG